MEKIKKGIRQRSQVKEVSGRTKLRDHVEESNRESNGGTKKKHQVEEPSERIK